MPSSNQSETAVGKRDKTTKGIFREGEDGGWREVIQAAGSQPGCCCTCFAWLFHASYPSLVPVNPLGSSNSCNAHVLLCQARHLSSERLDSQPPTLTRCSSVFQGRWGYSILREVRQSCSQVRASRVPGSRCCPRVMTTHTSP